MLVTIAIKLLFSCFLLWIAVLCGIGVWRLWFDQQFSLVAFKYTRDGAKVDEAGLNFTQLVSQDLKRLAHLYTNEANKDALMPSTDQFGRGGKVTLPEMASSPFTNIEVEAYGLKLGTIYKALQQWIEPPNEIVGTISERDKVIDVFVEIRGAAQRKKSERQSWYLAQKLSQTEASFELACSIFRSMAASSPLFRDVSDSDFYLFTRASEKYRFYSERLKEGGKSELATKALEDAHGLVNDLVARETRLPHAYKLAGYIYRDKGKLVEAEKALNRYLDLLKAGKGTDAPTVALVAKIHETLNPAPTPQLASDQAIDPRARRRPIVGGISVGAPGRVGTLTCLVKDAAGKVYLLSAEHVFTGAFATPVRQPSDLDGAGDADVVGRIAHLLPPSSGKPRTFALAELAPGVAYSAELLGLGVPKGIASETARGETLRAAGRTSGVVTAQVNGIDFEMNISVLEGMHRFSGLVTTTPITQGGDSGAPVMTADGKLFGMIFAGSPQATIVVPIAPFLREHNLTLVQ